MRVLFLTGSDVSAPLLYWLKTGGDVQVTRYSEPISVQVCDEVRPDMVVSYNYRHIIKPDVLERVHGKAINLHISYLPWNRGAHPNVWSFLDDTPKGVTVHLVDRGIDTGGILLQQELQFDPDAETFQTSYEKLHVEIQRLFKESWGRLRTFSVPARLQDPREGSRHFARDLDRLLEIAGSSLWNTPISEIKRRYRTAAQ